MDYEKLYKEAFERAKDLHDNHPLGTPQTWMTCEKIFPELKESNDERIREEIISFLKEGTPYYCPNSVRRQEWIDWLEKQAEQKPAIEGTFINVDEVREDFMQEVYSVLNDDATNDRANQIIDFFDHLPAITIQKPVEIDESSDMVEALRTEYEKGRADSITEMKQTKCSEEDEKIINEVASILINDENRADNKIEEDRLAYLAERIQSFRPRLKQEWSEDDEVRLTSTIQKLEYAKSLNAYNEYGKDSIIKNIDWLKSLRPQFHWKPTEYDISLLEDISRNIRNNIRPFCSEVSALEDLIKNIKTL